ncbi:MAG TPA: WYL domain-containing protein [Pirellulales bacterium]
MQLISLLQAGKGQNADALSAFCGVSRRTLFRDLDLLRQAGVPVLFDDDEGCYRLEHAYFLPPTTFTTEEALAMLLVCYELGAGGRMPFYSAARQAAIKLEACLPASLREQVRSVTAAVQIHMTPTNPLAGAEPVYRQLLHCASHREAVRIRYQSFAEDAEIVTKLSPYRLLFSRHSWYAIGRSSLHREVRTFNVGRVGALQLLNERFEVPHQFSIDRYLGNAWHLIPEPGPDADVLVRFEKLVARNVAEVHWHKTQRVEFLPDGRLDFRATVSGLGEISWWLLGYGDQVEVLEPVGLRRMVAERVGRLAARYGKDG